MRIGGCYGLILLSPAVVLGLQLLMICRIAHATENFNVISKKFQTIKLYQLSTSTQFASFQSNHYFITLSDIAKSS